jgi:hypothetical protein
MGKDAKVNLGLLREARSAAEERHETSFQAGDRTFALCTLPVFELGKATVHLSPVLGPRPTSPTSFVQMDDRAADAERLASEDVIVLGVVACIGQDTVDLNSLAGAPKRRSHERRVLARAIAHQHIDDQVGGVMADQGQLRPLPQPIAFLSGSKSIMRRAMSGLETCGIDADLFLGADESLRRGSDEDGIEQVVKPSFFNSRCWAL